MTQFEGTLIAGRYEIREHIATGGMADLIVPHARTLEKTDPFLTLEGVRLIWERNRD